MGWSSVISDGAHNNGNPDFFFLPPLQLPPRGNVNFDHGKFNPNLQPIVTICNGRTLTPKGDCATPLMKSGKPVAFVAVRGWDGLPDWVDPAQYHVLWQTRNYSLVADGKHAYRVVVKVGTTMLGYLDLVPTASLLGAVRISAGGQDVGWLDDLAVPIRFRIEQGALCDEGTTPGDCSETTVVGPAKGTPGDTGQKIVIPSGDAALALPPDAVKPGDTVTFVIEKQVPPYEEHGTPQCLPTGLAQSKGCWNFSSQPAGYVFQHDVKIEFCVDEEPVPTNERDQLRVFKNDSIKGLQELPWADPTDIDCSTFTAMGRASSASSSFASAALRQLGKLASRLFLPRPLYAYRHGSVPKGLGGTGGSFSDFGGAVPVADIDTVVPSETRLVIDAADSILFTSVLMNNGSSTLTGMRLKAWVVQPGVSKYALSDSGDVWCGQAMGEMPPGTCTLGRAFWVSNSFPGSGTLVAGPALLHVELWQAGTVLATDSAPLVLSSVEIRSMSLVSSYVLLGADSTISSAELVNHGSNTLLGVEFHAWIEQPGASHEAHSAVTLNAGIPFCSPTLGALPPGTCTDGHGVFASNSNAGYGTLVPGNATLRLELTQADTVVASQYTGIILTPAEIEAAGLGSRTMTIGGAPLSVTFLLANTGAPLSGAQVQAIIQGPAGWRPAGLLDVQCGSGAGNLPTGHCTFTATVAASNSGPGTFTLVPGAGWVVFTLIQGTTTFGGADWVPVTLLGPTQIAAGTVTGQSAVAGSPVATPPAVIVRDKNGNPVGEVSVTFAVTAGGGTVTPAQVVTGSNGIAAVTSWTLGATAGTNTLTASASGLSGGPLAGSPVAFSATGTPGTATQIASLTPYGQTALFGTAVPTPPSVIVRDANGNPVSGVTVSFLVTGGGGSIVPTDGLVMTDVNGVAALNRWTLGPTAGTNTLIATPNPVLPGSPLTFTATGSLLPPDVTSSMAFEGNGHIYRLDPGATTWVDITTSAPAGSWSGTPSWSPDGATLVFASDRGGSPGQWHIWTMDRNGHSVTQLTSDAAADISPAISPSGHVLAFSRYDGSRYVIYLGDLPGTLWNPITDGEDATWSPDNLDLVYHRYYMGSSNRSIWWVPVLDSLQTHQVTTTSSVDYQTPSWSPTGDVIAYSCEHGGTAVDICLSTSGGVFLNQFGDGTLRYGPRWSPNGNWIAFTRVSGGTHDIYIMHPDGTSLTRITDGSMQFASPAWPQPYHP